MVNTSHDDQSIPRLCYESDCDEDQRKKHSLFTSCFHLKKRKKAQKVNKQKRIRGRPKEKKPNHPAAERESANNQEPNNVQHTAGVDCLFHQGVNLNHKACQTIDPIQHLDTPLTGINKSPESSRHSSVRSITISKTDFHPLSQGDKQLVRPETPPLKHNSRPPSVHYHFHNSSIDNLHTGDNIYHKAVQTLQNRREVFPEHNLNAYNDFLSNSQRNCGGMTTIVRGPTGDDEIVEERNALPRPQERSAGENKKYSDSSMDDKDILNTIPQRRKSTPLITSTVPSRAFMNSDSCFDTHGETFEMKTLKQFLRPKLAPGCYDDLKSERF